ncbi:MAG: hypothetical protein LC121_04860, partial [Anaerolineae bacterium]|nr:hypothetical protein [Anaerolineae bacterium]
MTLVRFRLPEIALLTCLVTIWPLTPAYGQAPPAPRRPTPPAPSLMPPAFSSVPAATTTPVPAQTPAQPPAAAGQAPIAGQAAVATAATAAATVGGLNLQNVNLSEVIDFLARELKINYILDKRLNLGGVTLNTYGEVKDMDKRALLDTILRINGAAMVQTGAIYRIVPLADLPRMPLRPEVDAKSIPEDDQAMLNLIFLKYANVDELSKLIGEFLGPEGKAWSYPPANLLLLLDSRRSMRRTMEMIALFDSDLLAKQRVRLFEIKYSRPSDLSRELADLLKSMSLSKDLSSVKFVPVDRINTLIAVAPNPGVFDQVQEWISRLDLRVKSAAGRTTSYTYRVRYGNAQMLAMSIMMLYAQIDPLMAASLPMGMGMMGMGMMGGMGGYGMMGGYGGMGGMGGYGMMGGMGGYGMMGGFPGMMGMLGGYPGMYGNYGAVSSRFGGSAVGVAPQGGTGVADQTGQFLSGSGAAQPTGGVYQGPRVVPNPTDNSLLILATPDEYESILRLLHELDIPPRQVLIEAKIYE